MGLEQIRHRVQKTALFKSPVELLMRKDGFGLEKATALQQAIMWTLAGRGVPDELWRKENVSAAYGDCRPLEQPKEVTVLCGVRGGKTLLAGCAGVWMTQSVRLDAGAGMDIRPGEIPRVSIVSERTSATENAFNFITGAVLASPVLSKLLTEPPRADSLTLRHPSGVPIEIACVAGSSAGITVIGRWCAGIIFDEAPRMASEAEGSVVNLEDMIRNVRGRMLMGACIMLIGSPWGPTGYVYNSVTENFGKQGTKTVVRARGSWMNPTHWTPERIESLKSEDIDTYRTDELAEFRDPETALLSASTVDGATRKEPAVLEPQPQRKYTAAMDPGFRGNSWTFGIAETEDNVHYKVAMVTQWTGSKHEPLSAVEVLTEMAQFLVAYGITTVMTDQYSVDTIRDLALLQGFGVSEVVINALNKTKRYNSLKVRLEAGFVELPPDEKLRQDLLNLKRRTTTDGVRIVAAETKDGRHCDYASMLMLLCGGYLEESNMIESPFVSQERRLANEAETRLDWWELEKEDYGSEGDAIDWF